MYVSIFMFHKKYIEVEMDWTVVMLILVYWWSCIFHSAPFIEINKYTFSYSVNHPSTHKSPNRIHPWVTPILKIIYINKFDFWGHLVNLKKNEVYKDNFLYIKMPTDWFHEQGQRQKCIDEVTYLKSTFFKMSSFV